MNGHTFTHPSNREWLDIEEVSTVPGAAYKGGRVHLSLTNGQPFTLGRGEWDRLRAYGCIEREVLS